MALQLVKDAAQMGAELDGFNRSLRDLSPTEIILRARDMGQRPMITTSFGPESAVLLHLLSEHFPRLPVIWMDSGYNTPETYRFAEQMRTDLNLDMHIYRPAPELDPSFDLDTASHERKSQHFKREPFERALKELKPDLWFAGIRRDETEFRRSLDVLSWGRPGLLRVAPLFHTDKTWADNYLSEHDLPGSHDYLDIVKGQQEKQECGLHLS